MDDVDAVVVLGAAPDAGDTVVARRPAHRTVRLAADALEHLLRHLSWHAARRQRRAAAARAAVEASLAVHQGARCPERCSLSSCCAARTRCPYLETKTATGGRSEVELVAFSARPSSYLVATPDNVLWGRAFASRGRLERRLFPGVLVVVLAMVGLLLRPPPKVALVYLVALVVAFDMSLGLSGLQLSIALRARAALSGAPRTGEARDLRGVLPGGPRGLRVRRAGRSCLPPKARLALAVGLCALLLLEYRVRPLELVPYPNSRSAALCLALAHSRAASSRSCRCARSGLPGFRPGVQLPVDVPLDAHRERL